VAVVVAAIKPGTSKPIFESSLIYRGAFSILAEIFNLESIRRIYQGKA
jgi:hypothetical protein